MLRECVDMLRELAPCSVLTSGNGDRVLHLHDNAGLACVPMPKAFVDSPTYSGPEACKVSHHRV